MKLFYCQNCDQLLYFENTRCERCQLALGYLPALCELSALEPLPGGAYRALANPGGEYRYCANERHAACNWMVAADGPQQLCAACRLNRTVPNLHDRTQLARWRELEAVKRRLVYSLLRLELPIVSKRDDPDAGLAFDFLENVSDGANVQGRVMTGHANGLITIDTAEADPAERERRRVDLAEPYRTLPGHMRHEIGHYYWERLFQTENDLTAFRDVFGDERADYGKALQRYYADGPAENWRDRFVSAYAGAHPWEDWAETWAHCLHIIDATETALVFGLAPQHWMDASAAPPAVPADPFDTAADFDAVLASWLPITFAVNSLNRSMGQPDLYPFVLSAGARRKLRFAFEWIRRRGGGRAARQPLDSYN